MRTVFKIVVVAAAAGLQGTQGQLVTCPGFAGYCSETYPGNTCTVVCAFGRNNVPLCQADGTWTDVPRCIEHEPGKPQQRTGWCPGVPGYCSDSPPGSLCEFDCLFGKDISSYCTTEGTWDPYPVCEGDIRETRDGCDGCPGPFGGPRDRTKEGGGSSGGGGATRKQQPPARKQTPARKQGNNRNNPRAIGGGNRSNQNNVTRKNGGGNKRGNNRNAGNRKNNNNRNKNGGNGNNRKNNRNGNNNRKNNRNGANNKRNNNRNGSNNRKNNRNGNNRNGGNNRNNRKPGASQSRSNNRAGIEAQPRPTNRKNGGSCTEEVLTKCMDVCPSEPINIFKACIKGCAKRC